MIRLNRIQSAKLIAWMYNNFKSITDRKLTQAQTAEEASTFLSFPVTAANIAGICKEMKLEWPKAVGRTGANLVTLNASRRQAPDPSLPALTEAITTLTRELQQVVAAIELLTEATLKPTTTPSEVV